MDSDENTPTSYLSPYYEHLISALLRATDRQDSVESNLRVSAYEALASLITSAAHVSFFMNSFTDMLVGLLAIYSQLGRGHYGPFGCVNSFGVAAAQH